MKVMLPISTAVAMKVNFSNIVLGLWKKSGRKENFLVKNITLFRVLFPPSSLTYTFFFQRIAAIKMIKCCYEYDFPQKKNLPCWCTFDWLKKRRKLLFEMVKVSPAFPPLVRLKSKLTLETLSHSTRLTLSQFQSLSIRRSTDFTYIVISCFPFLWLNMKLIQET